MNHFFEIIYINILIQNIIELLINLFEKQISHKNGRESIFI